MDWGKLFTGGYGNQDKKKKKKDPYAYTGDKSISGYGKNAGSNLRGLGTNFKSGITSGYKGLRGLGRTTSATEN